MKFQHVLDLDQFSVSDFEPSNDIVEKIDDQWLCKLFSGGEGEWEN